MTLAFQPAMFDLSAVTDARTGLERYDSPDWAVDDLIANLPFYLSGRVLEPCHGQGMLSLPLAARGFKVTTNDLDTRTDAQLHYDAHDPHAPFDGYDWAITNPPFSLAVGILDNLLPRVRCGALFLLRVTFSEPTSERAEFFTRWPLVGQITTQRFSFTRDGSSDSATTAWFCWLKRAQPLYEGAPGYAVWPKGKEFFRVARRRG